MGTDIWINVNVTGLPESFKVDKLPDVQLVHQEGWDFTKASQSAPGQPMQPAQWWLAGSGRYGDVGILKEWAADITAKRAAVVVSISEEWDDDGGGHDITVYQGGMVDRPASRVQVLAPLDYGVYIAELKTAIIAWEASLTQPMGTINAGERMKLAALKLIGGIE